MHTIKDMKSIKIINRYIRINCYENRMLPGAVEPKI